MADTPDPIDWIVERLGQSELLDAEDRTAITTLPFTMRDYEPGQYLLREGDKPKLCLFLVAGYVFRHKIVGDGGRQIVSVHVPGDLVDVQNMLLDQSDHNIQALSRAHIMAVPIEDFVAVAGARERIGRAVWRETLVEASVLREWIANIGRRDARSRTAHLLCELAVRSEAAGRGARAGFELPMTQEQLGDALGLTAVHVNRTLKTLEEAHLIRRNKRMVGIEDWDGLCMVGDFTTTYLHMVRRPAG